jgi:hypothetical protein
MLLVASTNASTNNGVAIPGEIHSLILHLLRLTESYSRGPFHLKSVIPGTYLHTVRYGLTFGRLCSPLPIVLRPKWFNRPRVSSV